MDSIREEKEDQATRKRNDTHYVIGHDGGDKLRFYTEHGTSIEAAAR